MSDIAGINTLLSYHVRVAFMHTAVLRRHQITVSTAVYHRHLFHCHRYTPFTGAFAVTSDVTGAVISYRKNGNGIMRYIWSSRLREARFDSPAR